MHVLAVLVGFDSERKFEQQCSNKYKRQNQFSQLINHEERFLQNCFNFISNTKNQLNDRRAIKWSQNTLSAQREQFLSINHQIVFLQLQSVIHCFPQSRFLINQIMRKNLHQCPHNKRSQANETVSQEIKSEQTNDENWYEGEELEIQLDYEELLKNRTIKDKKSNILIRLAPQEPNIKKKPKKVKQQKKPKKFQQIDTKDITDIIIIVLLVLILGVSLFRVVMEVQIQFKKAQQKFQRHNKGLNGISDQLTHNQNPQHKNTNSQSNLYKQPQITITLSEQCQKHIDGVLKEHGNLYEFKYPDKEMKIKSKVDVYVEAKNTFINKQKYSEAVTLLRVNHHINSDGTLVISGDPCESDSVKRQRLQKALNQQFNRWNAEYQIDSYHSKQIPFCLVVNSYNNAKNGLIYRNLDSILQQNYTNYHIVYTDDASIDQTGKKVTDYLKLKNFPQSRLNITINPTKKGMMENIYTAIYKGCKDGQIVVMLDGDDSLIGVNVLSLLNAVYQKYKPALLWTNFVSIFNNNQVSMGFSHDYTEKQKTESSFRKMKGFISSHLKTFFVEMFKKIRTEDLQLNNGRFFGGASDTAIMIPMIEMANPRFKYLSEVVYEYRYDTGQTGNVVNKVPQKQALGKIFTTQQYAKLLDFSFIEQAIQSALVITPLEKAIQQIGTETDQTEKSSQKLQEVKEKA